ncbi:MAG: PAS domain S-box protein [Desulfobulbaceae bacterium]|nr:PAS domain S-box protein [Desulfobulbaceae bacterium]
MSADFEKTIKELRHTLGKLDVAFGAIKDAIVWTDKYGLIQWCNTTFEKLIGTPRVTLLNRSLMEILPLYEKDSPLPENLHPCRQVFNKQTSSMSGIYTFYRKNDEIPLEIHAEYVSSSTEPGSAVLVLRDISDEKINEEIRLQSKALTAASDAIIITGPNGNFQWVNPAFFRLTGYQLSNVLNNDISLLFPTNSDTNLYQGIISKVRTGNVWKGEISVNRKDATLCQIIFNMTPVHNRNGEHTHCVAIMHDITQWKIAENKLTENEARLQAIFTTAVDAVITIDMKGLIDSLNPAAEKMFGYESGELHGRNINILMPEPYKSCHDGYLKKYMSTGHSKIIGIGREIVAQRRCGEIFPMELSISEVKLAKRHLFTAIIRDISSRKTAEKALQQAHEELQTKQKLLNEDLRAAADIQKSLLPHSLPNSGPIQIAWSFDPSTFVGGDIFNVFMINEQYMAAYILDVSGHGVTSALVAVSVAQRLQPHGNLLFDYELNMPVSPAKVLTTLDKEFPIERFDKFFTMIYLVIDLQTGHIQYSGAGHPPPMLINDTRDTVDLLDRGGSIIGLGNIIPFDEGEITLSPHDILLLYTDGVTEFSDKADNLFGQDKLLKTFLQTKAMTAEQSVNYIYKEITAFGKKTLLTDDISLLVLKYR